MKIRMMRQWLAMVAGALLLCGCSATRHLPEGSYMLDKVRVVTDGDYKDINTLAMKDYVRQKSNTRWLSTVKVPLGIYSLAGRDSSWMNRALWAMGESPVVFDTLLARQSCEDLKQALENKGYLDAEVSLYVDYKKRKCNAVYLLRPGTPYRIRQYDTEIQDTLIERLLLRRNGTLYATRQFSAEALSEERNQITSYLQDRGYFRFHKEFITYRARRYDKEKMVDVTLVLHPNNRSSEDSSSLHTQYFIRDVSFVSGMPDSTIRLRRHVLEENTFIEPGQPYSASNLRKTYNHFGRLNAVKFTNVNYEQVPGTALLDTKVMIQTNKPSTISFQPEGTNTSGDLGAAVSLTYQNRNLFRGSEVLSVQLRGAYEAIRGLEGYSNQDFFEYSLESRLSFPRFISPFLSPGYRRSIIASSEVSLMYDSQDRPEFHRRVLSAGWHYQWKRESSLSSYRLDLIDLNYVFMPWISDTFRDEYLSDDTNSNAILKYNYEDLFIMKIGFGYAYNNGRTAVKTNVETAGNLLDLSIDAARKRASLGEISYALEKVFGRYKAKINLISNVYSSQTKDSESFKKAQALTDEFAKLEGRRPRIMVAKMGQDGHDRGAKVVATGYADLGFDVDMGPLFQTPAEAAKQAVENDVHILGVSSLAAGHKTLVPQVIEELKKLGREDIMVVVGGVIPPQDYDFLFQAGAACVFGPGTVISESAIKMMELLLEARK